MSLFQKTIGKKYLSELNLAIINTKYTSNPEPGFNLTTELKKNISNNRSVLINYFPEQKEKALVLIVGIDKTDNEIDLVVLVLYGLSGEDISLVEGSK